MPDYLGIYWRRRAESNRRTRLCRPLPKPLGHAAKREASLPLPELTSCRIPSPLRCSAMKVTPKTMGVAIGGVLVLAGGLALGLVLGTGSPAPPADQTGAGQGAASVNGPASTSPSSTTTSTTRPSSPTTTAAPTTTQPAPTTTQPAPTTQAPSPATAPTSVTTTTAPTPTGPQPFARLTCKSAYGVRLCQGNGKGQRVPTFDGVPLDADVTLPPSGNGPFPLLVLLHGFGANKTAFEATSNDGKLDNVTMASHGWAVLTYTARGFGASCGTAASRSGTPACDRGWIHLADQRYEIRDTDYLAGMLVDEGIARPDFAVAGQSYGAGQTLELAVLKNRMMLTDGKLVNLSSPAQHVPMSVSAVYAQWPWDDLRERTRPQRPAVLHHRHAGRRRRQPRRGRQAELAAAPLQDGGPVLPGPAQRRPDRQPHRLVPASSWRASPTGVSTRSFLRQGQTYKSAIGVPMAAGGPAPTAISAGWNDTLFPVSEAQHYANRWTGTGIQEPLLLMYADIGHGWAQNKPADAQAVNDRAIAFLDAEGLHRGSPQTGLFATATTCPATASSGPTLTGSSLSGLATGSLTVTGASGQVVTSSGGNPSTAAALDPTSQSLCHPLPAATEPGTATYSQAVGRRRSRSSALARVQATVSIKGNYPELVARLWDVARPGGTQRQIAAMGGLDRRQPRRRAPRPTPSPRPRSTSRADPPGRLHLCAGDTVQLELVGSVAVLSQVQRELRASPCPTSGAPTLDSLSSERRSAPATDQEPSTPTTTWR